LSSIEEDENTPDPKYLQNILIKTWKRPEKVRKFGEVLEKLLNTQDRMEKCLVVIKVLLLLHNYMRKGPVEVFTTGISSYKGQKIQKTGYVKSILQNINNLWSGYAKFEKLNSLDKARSKLISYYIYLYCLVLIEKSELGEKLATCFHGNFSMEPFFLQQDSKLMFSSNTICLLIEYVHKCLLAFNLLKSPIPFKSLHMGILKALADEIYSVLSSLSHCIYTVKNISNHLKKDKIDQDKFRAYI
jgi:ANTH domain